MGLIAKSYDLAKVTLTVGGVPLGGYGADGGVDIEPVAPQNEVTVGADGLTVASKVNNTDAVAVITLHEMSSGYAALAALMQAQEISPSPTLLPIPFLLIDPANGDTISSAFSIFTDRPNVTKNRVSSERVFRIHLPGAYLTAVFGVNNVV